jgi:NTE family protein
MAQYNFQNLVFEGGGVKGIAYGGALDVLDEKGILSNIKRVAGTSAGAINASLLALGYTSKEVSNIVANTDFAKFADSGGIISDVARIIRSFGWNKGDAFKKFIREQIEAKTGNPDFTFAQLDQVVREKKNGFRHLYTVCTNLSRQQAQIFSHESTPDTSIADAVRMSMSIPLYFQAVRWKDEVMVDGGVSYNYPVNLFDNKKYLSKEVNGEAADYDPTPGFVFNHETLGFRLDSKDVIEYNRRGWQLPPAKIDNIKEYSLSLMDFMMEMANRAHLHDNDWNRTVSIDTLDVKTTDFAGVKKRVDDLIKSGRTAVTDYFTWRDSDPIWNKKPI